MKVIDLHGVRYKDIYSLLERPCVEDDVPFIVVTGHSDSMKKIVEMIVATFGLYTHEQMGNKGRLVICESR